MKGEPERAEKSRRRRRRGETEQDAHLVFSVWEVPLSPTPTAHTFSTEGSQPLQARAESSIQHPQLRTDLLLGDADGVLLDAVTIRSGAAGGLDAAHESLLTLLQAQADVLELREIRPGNCLVLVFCKLGTNHKSSSQPRSVPARSPPCWHCGAEVFAQVENKRIRSSRCNRAENGSSHRTPHQDPHPNGTEL